MSIDPPSGPRPVWIDLANSPHVLFFSPIIAELSRHGIELLVTARDFAQTLELAGMHGIDPIPVGFHGGKGTTAKLLAIMKRAGTLARIARDAGACLAVGHNSYAQAIAARRAGIRVLTLMDFEHTPANHICFRLAHRILLPSVLPLSEVRKYGATAEKVRHYPGFKEQVYLDGFVPRPGTLTPPLPSDLWERHVVAVARPPADFAVYHRFENPLFEMWLKRAGILPEVRIIVLPRTDSQRTRLLELDLPSVIVPEIALDGATLIHGADLVVSAGGTMNREAAVLGVPAYSLFAGKTAAVDRALERDRRLTFIRREEDLGKIVLERKRPVAALPRTNMAERLSGMILEEI